MTLAEVTAQIAALEDFDLYRFDPPRDPSGGNVFQVAERRLEQAEVAASDPRALAAIRFGLGVARTAQLDLDGAREAFESVAASDSPLSGRAEQRARRVAALSPLLAPLPEQTLRDAMLEIAHRRGRLAEARARPPGEGPAWLFDAVAERLDVTERELLWRARALHPRGVEVALEAARQTADDHAESRFALAHLLRLADMVEEIARERIATRPPGTAGFDVREVRALLEEAGRLYAEVSVVEGRPERDEARARMAALESLWLRLGEAGG